MKPTIKYLLNGEYHYATVKDIGDIDKLKTAVTTDLVGAINSLIGQTGEAEIPEDLTQLLEQFEQDIDGLKVSGFNEKELLEIQAKVTEITEDVEARIVALKETYENRLDEVTSVYDNKVTEINTDLENVKTNIESTESSLEEVGKKLSGVELNVTNVTKSVDEINGSLASKIDSTEFNLLESTVSENETAIKQNKKDIELKASQENLDLATGRIEEAESKIELNAQGITSAVKRNELREELDGINIYGDNLLKSTRDWEGWKANTPARAYITNETYNHTHIQEQTGSGNYLEIELTDLEVGRSYTASVWAKSTSSSAKAIFKADSSQHEMTNHNNDVFLNTSWQRMKTVFVATGDKMKVSFTVSNADNSATSHFAGGKVELGTTATGWQANEDDVYERVVSAESLVKQHADQITSLVSEQTKIGENVTSQQTEINQMSDSIGLHADKLEEIDGEITEQKASIELNSQNILSKVEQTDIDKSIEGITLDSRNLVLNSDFILDLENWSSVNENFKVKEVDGKNHLAISRSGLSSNMVASASSNMFAVKSGDKLSIGLDVTVDNLDRLDNKTIVVLDMFDINDNRVDFKEFTIAELEGSLSNGITGRLTTRYNIDRADVSKARLRLTLYRNGSLSFTNITIEKGDIKSIGWTPAPEDSQLVQANMKTMIDQNAQSISLKAESDTVDKISGRLETNEAELKVANDAITANVNKLTNVDGTLSEHSAKIEANAEEISSKMTSTEVDELLSSKKYATQSELKQTSDGITASVSSVSSKLDSVEEDFSGLRGSFTELSNVTLPALEDGVLNKAEKEAVKQSLNVVRTDKSGFDSQYTAIYNNKELTGTPKTNLYNAKVSYNTAFGNLEVAINAVLRVADGTRISKSQIDNVDTKFGAYSTVLATLNRIIEEALDAISGKKVGDVSNELSNVERRVSTAESKITDEAITNTVTSSTAYKGDMSSRPTKEESEAYIQSETKKVKEGLEASIGGVSTSLSNLNKEIKGTFKDGLIQEAEAKSIETYINTLASEKSSLDKRYNSIYGNNSLAGTAKSNLNVAKVEYNTAHTNIVNTINSVIADGKVTTTESNSVDSVFTAYQGKLATLSTRFEEALNYIATAKADEAERKAKKHADDGLRPIAERVTQAEQKITDDAIRSTVTSSTTFKDVQSKANSAKETLDSKSGTWDSKATTNYVDGKASTAETNAKSHADSKASTAETNAKKYADDNIKTWEKSYRVNTANPLPLTRIDGSSLDDMYSYEIHAKVTGTGTVTSAHAVFKANNSGGTGGKGWTLVMIDEHGKGSNNPEIFMNSGVPSIRLYGHSSYYNVAITHHEAIGVGSTAVQARDAKSVADEAKTTANTLKNTTVPQLVQRVNTAEQKITDKAIVSTVTESTTYKDEMSGKVGVNEVISRINQTANNVTIDAKNINLNGAVTISSFGKGLKDDFEATKSNAGTALDRVTIKDTRTTNQSPSWYYQNYPSQTVTETKEPSVMGFTGTAVGTLTTVVPSSNASGGAIKQTFRTSSESWRRSGTTSWTGWFNYDRDARLAKAGLEEVDSKINNAVTTIDGTGVTVKDGSFFLVDDTTDTKYAVPTKENLIKNHSFELVNQDSKTGKLHMADDEWEFIHEDQYEVLAGAGFIIEGSQAVQVDGATHVPVNFFGNYSMMVNNKNYLKTRLSIRDNGRYTISAYFRRPPYAGGGGQPRFKMYEHDVRGGSRDIGTFTFDRVEDFGDIKRYSATFDAMAYVPAGVYDPDSGNPLFSHAYTFLEIMSASSDFVQVDGVQLVEGETPVVYDAEVNHWDFINGGSSVKELSTRSVIVGGLDGKLKFSNYRVGTSEIYTGDASSSYTGLNIRGDSGINLLSSNGNINVKSRLNADSGLHVSGDFNPKGNIIGNVQTYKNTGKTAGSINATASNSNRWNSPSNNSLMLRNSNNALAFIVGGTSNNRQSIIQGGHNDAGFANHLSSLYINKLGGMTYIGAGLSVSGSKNAIHITRDGMRATPAYEMAESYLGDMGEDVTGLDGSVDIMIDTLFFDTINTDYTYHVFLQAHSNNKVWVEKRNAKSFVVKSDAPNVSFSWEMKAKRRGYEKDRLVRDDNFTYEDIQTMQEYTGAPEEPQILKGR